MSNIEKIQISLMPVFKAHNVRKAILFGSYAKGRLVGSGVFISR